MSPHIDVSIIPMPVMPMQKLTSMIALQAGALGLWSLTTIQTLSFHAHPAASMTGLN